MLLKALLINAVVLAVVLESDLGRHRAITRFRLLRPLITSLLIVPFFIKGAATAGTGLALEVALIAAGLLAGLLATSQMAVYLSPKTGRPVTRAGLAFALVWAVVMVARTTFSYGSAHWFAAPLGRWMASQHVTSDALTDALIFMALAMVLTRVVAMAIRGHAVTRRAARPAIPTLMPSPATADAKPHPWGLSGSAAASEAGHAVAAAVAVVANRRRDRQEERTARRASRRRVGDLR
jgi:Ni/Fe-hydrogenase subunit HybB-like protein